MAQSHEALATGIETDAEKPLREYETKNADMKSMVSIQNDLSSLVKTLETAQKKLDKIKDKGPKHASKVPGAQSAVDDAKTQWQSRAPFVLEQLQAIDEHRVNHLRDILTQYQTHESDQVERSRQAAESSLNCLLNIQAGEEIRAYVSKKSGGRLPAEIAPSTPATPSARQETPTSPKPTLPAMAEPLPSPPPVHDDSASQRSGMSAQRRPSLQQGKCRPSSIAIMRFFRHLANAISSAGTSPYRLWWLKTTWNCYGETKEHDCSYSWAV